MGQLHSPRTEFRPAGFSILRTRATHDHGNEENIFDRVDYKVSTATAQSNLQYTRSWFQTPNSNDQLNEGVTDPFGESRLPQADQRSQIKTFNIAPSWTHCSAPTACSPWVGSCGRTSSTTIPSPDPFADFGPHSAQTVGQSRRLTNWGIRANPVPT